MLAPLSLARLSRQRAQSSFDGKKLMLDVGEKLSPDVDLF
jgi:hypothetical protein